MAQEPEKKKTVSVFDFLYVDHHRIGLFLSMFSEFGNLTDIVHSISASRGSSGTIGFKNVLSGEQKNEAQETLQRSYNTQWTQALNFLDEVKARKMLTRSISDARIGGLLLSSGTLSILNMRPLERSWGVVAENTEKENLRSGNRDNRHTRRRKQATGGGEPQEMDSASGLRLLGSLEQPILMTLQTGTTRLWSTLEPNYLIGGSSDLTLKQGIRIAGDWHVVGILDCLPGEPITDEAIIGRMCGDGDNVFSSTSITLWRELGLVLGRPSECYGITPIMIMREVLG